MTTEIRTLKSALFAGCAMFALAGTAHAETAPATPAAGDAAAAPGEIVVTAQRRNESIQNVPMTLQALSGDALSKLNVTTFSDLLKYTPNVTFGSNGPGQGAIFMRGLSAGFAGNQSTGTIAPFPNVALYLDDQSMQFPARNADIYMADMERVEVLEGPQGTLFGGGAQAGAVRYITNKPNLEKYQGKIEGSFGGTAGGAPNAAFNATINVPLVSDTLAIRATVYDDHHGGYIDNVYSNFTRQASDPGSVSYGFIPTATNQANAGQYNNASQVKKNYNPVDYLGGRVSLKWQVTPDWDLLVSESYQQVNAEGTFASLPTGSDFQKLGALQTTTFSPSWNDDTYWNTAWTVNGKIGDWKLVYTGAYMTRHINEQQDYTNYSRTGGGMYYQCTGSATGFGSGSTYCYSPVANWNDQIRNTHHSEELRVSSPEDKRVRVIAGAYWEQFRISDVMRFNYETIPGCTSSVTTACIGQVQTYPGATANQPGLEPAGTAFGEDTQRGYRQFAFFGSADVDILPNLTLTGGTRYYNYKEYERGSQYQTGTQCWQVQVCPLSGVPATDIGSGNVNIDALGDNVTYHGFKSKAELVWKPRRGEMFYAVFSQGFRPGGFNRAPKNVLSASPYGPANGGVAGNWQFARPVSYAPDSLTNWEIGSKTDLFDHALTLNLSAYYMVWQNVQLAFFNPPAGLGNTTFFTNGPNYHIKGVEAQFVARPTSQFNVQGSATYNDSKQVNSPCFVSNISSSPTYGQCIKYFYAKNASTSTQEPLLFGAPGGTTPFSPHFQGNIRGRYEWQGAANLNWFATAGVTYTGGMNNVPANYPTGETLNPPYANKGPNGVLVPGTTTLLYRQPGYALVDASIGFSKDSWTITFYGENLTNTHASTFTTSGQFIKAEVPVRPLVYGMKIGTSF